MASLSDGDLETWLRLGERLAGDETSAANEPG
jgi:hypothetical protein